MWYSLAVNVIMSAISAAVKNPQKRAELKDKLLEVRDAINQLYPDSKH